MRELFDNDRIYFSLGALGYFLAFLAGLPALAKTPGSAERCPIARFSRRLVPLLVLAGFVLQSIGLYLRGMQAGHCPIGNAFEVFQFITWSLVILYGCIGSAFRMSLLGFFTAGLAAVLSIVSLAFTNWDGLAGRGIPGGPWVEAHASLSLVSYGAFGMLALTSAMYLLQLYGIKHRRWEGFFERLPSLVEAERMNLRLLSLSVGIYTVAVAVGAVSLVTYSEHIIGLKLIFALTAWVGYALALALRLMGRLYARRLAILCVLLFVFALLTLYPVERNRGAHTTPQRIAQEVVAH